MKLLSLISLSVVTAFLFCSARPAGESAKTPVRLFFEYSSACCPRDPELDKEKKSKSEVVAEFYLEKKVKMTGGYRVRYGREGENKNYYTLSELTKSQRKELINRIIKNYKPEVPAAEKAAVKKKYLNMLDHPVEMRTMFEPGGLKLGESLEKYRIKD